MSESNHSVIIFFPCEGGGGGVTLQDLIHFRKIAWTLTFSEGGGVKFDKKNTVKGSWGPPRGNF